MVDIIKTAVDIKNFANSKGYKLSLKDVFQLRPIPSQDDSSNYLFMSGVIKKNRKIIVKLLFSEKRGFIVISINSRYCKK